MKVHVLLFGVFRKLSADVKHMSEKQHEQLERVIDKAHKFQAACDALVPWVEQSEELLNELKPSVLTRDAVQRHLQEAKVPNHSLLNADNSGCYARLL